MIIKDLNKIDPEKCKNIIFDWGGVIINIDYNATVEAFNKLGDVRFEEYYTQANQKQLFDLLEVGKIDEKQFIREVKAEFNNGITDNKIVDAWCSMLKDTPRNRIDTLLRLKEKYRIFLLSNTNCIHERIVVETINSQLGFEFFTLFEKVYLSHKVGFRKPNADIFEFVIKDKNLVKEETIFIDDSEQHVVGASNSGINAIHLKQGMDIVEMFKNW